MILGKAKIDLSNSIGEVKKGMICEIHKVWLNEIQGDILVDVEFRENGLKMITSIDNIETLKIIDTTLLD